ncbi:MAG: response regulator [Planctomycetota bacterium]|nr:MAG: response regulator [Planctomycetota bacterium]
MTAPGPHSPSRLLTEARPFLGEPPELSDVAAVLIEAIPPVVGEFYASILRSTAAWDFIRSQERLQRLHGSLQEWLEAFLTSPPDGSLRAGLALRMANRHIREGIPLDLTLLAHANLGNLLTQQLVRRWPAGRPEGLAGALDRLQRALSFDSVLLVSAYHGLAMARESAASDRTAQLNQHLQQALRSQEMLLRATSHELRTPLTGLLGLLNLLQRGVYRSPEERSSAESDMQQAVRHLLALVDDLLHLAQLELGKGRLELREFGARSAAEAIARRFETRYREAGLSLVVRPGADLQVSADQDRYEQVLSNLLQNALQHTRQGGATIEVEPLPGGSHALTRVRDSGAGIEPELAERLFEPFSQGAGSGGSLGLGLAICRRLVLRMGGRIRALSAGAGCGASFEFTLPAAGRRRRRTGTFGRADARHRILLVDDDAVWREDLGRWLAEGCGARVDAAGEVEAALASARTEIYHLLLVDVAMPTEGGERMQDGFSLLEALASQPATLLVPKWLLSGHDRGFLETELRHAWHDAFWSKGDILADRSAFLEAVRRQLESGRPVPAGS